MRATLEYIKQKFDEYNNLMFEGKLKPLPFKLSMPSHFSVQYSSSERKIQMTLGITMDSYSKLVQ